MSSRRISATRWTNRKTRRLSIFPSPIELAVVKRATQESIWRLDANFFRVRFDRLTPREKEYMRALADMGDTTQRSGDIAERLHVKVQSIAPVRNGLIKKGMIYSPGHGATAFTGR